MSVAMRHCTQQSGQLFQQPPANKSFFFWAFNSRFLLLFFLLWKSESRGARLLTPMCNFIRGPPGCEMGHLVRHFNTRHVCFWALRVPNPTRHWYSLLKANSSRNHSGAPRDDGAQRGDGGGGGPFIMVSENHHRTAFCRARSGGHYGPDLFGAHARRQWNWSRAKDQFPVWCSYFPPSVFWRIRASVARQSDIRSGFLPLSITVRVPPHFHPSFPPPPSHRQAAIAAF